MNWRWLRWSRVGWSSVIATLAVGVALSACTTTKRAAKLQADLEQSHAALAVESDPNRQLELLRQHVALQDAFIAELLEQGHAQHGGGHQQAKTEGSGEQPTTHEH